MTPETDNSVTSLSLLASLCESDAEQGWSEFTRRYRPRIVGWCRHWGLNEDDANDVTQNVLMQISRQMKSFRYDPSGRFRSWLKTVAWRAWADFLKNNERNVARPTSADVQGVLQSVPARDDLMQRLEEEADRELLEAAMEQVRRRVQANTWEAFRLVTFENQSGAAAANKLQMTEASVFVARSRIQKMLLKEIKRLDHDLQEMPNR